MQLRIEGHSQRGVLSRYLVINALRRQPLPRAELARRLSLSPATVTAIVDDLQRQGVIAEAGLAPSDRGRRPMLLQLRPDAAYAVGIDITSGPRLRAVLLDLSCATVATASLELPDTSPGTVTDSVCAAADELLATPGVDRRKVLGVGITSPGPVDYTSGMVQRSVHFGWRAVPFGSLVAEQLGRPVFVDIDVNLMAIGEYWGGEHQGRGDDYAFVTVGAGIAGAFLVNGEVVRRPRTSIGELGHTIIQAGGLPCECGSRGCLETVASQKTMMAHLTTLLGEGADSRLRRLGAAVTPEVVYEAAAAGDATACLVVERVGHYVGLAVANLVNLLGPPVVCIGGPISPALGVVLPVVQEAARAGALPELATHCRIVASQLGSDATVVGAAALVLEEAFRVPTGAAAAPLVAQPSTGGAASPPPLGAVVGTEEGL